MIAKHRSWNAPVTLGDLGVSEDMIPALAENAMMLGAIGNIKRIEYNDVVNIFKLAL
jgi:alcohol dehydrogenase YqhD (iron-dependent ADH family)